MTGGAAAERDHGWEFAGKFGKTPAQPGFFSGHDPHRGRFGRPTGQPALSVNVQKKKILPGHRVSGVS
jgi:hypothetical protein